MTELTHPHQGLVQAESWPGVSCCCGGGFSVGRDFTVDRGFGVGRGVVVGSLEGCCGLKLVVGWRGHRWAAPSASSLAGTRENPLIPSNHGPLPTTLPSPVLQARVY